MLVGVGVAYEGERVLPGHALSAAYRVQIVMKQHLHK